MAQNIEMLLVGRVIQGLGAGGQLGLVNVTISDLIAVRYVRGFGFLTLWGNEALVLTNRLENGGCILAMSG